MPARQIERRRATRLHDTFAKNILSHRTRLGLTQDELAERCGFHRTYIGSVERGERNATLATVEAFATALGVEPHSLLIDPCER
jgi:transcriptional regulator with XRE-family HTH domain